MVFFLAIEFFPKVLKKPGHGALLFYENQYTLRYCFCVSIGRINIDFCTLYRIFFKITISDIDIALLNGRDEEAKSLITDLTTRTAKGVHLTIKSAHLLFSILLLAFLTIEEWCKNVCFYRNTNKKLS